MGVIKLRELLLSLAASAAASLLGTLLGGDMSSAYHAMNLPALAPPAAVFPIVWTILYVLMALALYHLLITPQTDYYLRRSTLVLYFSGLLLSALWPGAFFRLGQYTLSFFMIVAMIALGVLTVTRMRRICERSAWLDLPYLVWLVYALYLCYGVARLNR